MRSTALAELDTACQAAIRASARISIGAVPVSSKVCHMLDAIEEIEAGRAHQRLGFGDAQLRPVVLTQDLLGALQLLVGGDLGEARDRRACDAEGHGAKTRNDAAEGGGKR